MALTLTEDAIRSRVSLTHDNLEDVKSLSLPGTYHEKIVSLGTSLRKFTKLKSLDLSRNALESLQGLESLGLLEKLNLYYNNIGSLEELKRLKHTPNLKELDLRLNPVTRSEPDYRLYLIHMLPSLQKLDDRSVRDRERQAALTHFSSSQATEMTYHPPKKEQTQKSPHPRAEFTSKLGKPSVLDDDDVAILDLIAKKNGDLGQPTHLTGSVAREPAMEEYSLEMLKSLSTQDLSASETGLSSLPPTGKAKKASSLPPPKNDDNALAAYKDRYPNIASIASNELPLKSEHKRYDPHLQYQDEVDAYSKYRSHGYFTPNPTKEENPSDVSQLPTERGAYPPPPDLPTRVGHERERGREKDSYKDGGDAEMRTRHRRTNSVPSNTQVFSTEQALPEPSQPTWQSLHPSSKRHNAGLVQARLNDNPVMMHMLFRILDYVDRYWNGSKSLHQHAKFLGLALDVIEDMLKDGSLTGLQSNINTLKQHVERLKEENTSLRESQARNSNKDTTTASEAQLKMSLKQARSEVERLGMDLEQYVKENNRLQRKLDLQESAASYNLGGAAPAPTLHNDLQRQNEALSHEIDGLRNRLKQYAQMQELASMLQRTHLSLVQTNDHLLREMEEERRRHRHEVEQMRWSYDQLKKTMSYLPSTIKHDSTVTTNNITSTASLFRDTDH
ncbi:centrosomal protein of 72 kDa-like [Pomacea canaliculata]|uniref:centrosomal protein of 72 kDa-like n=1 Tax=Pomacea canaliculata TaxID=400727 RepID=UPI000D729A85|nr:centrosomal protein of 72 kDa-like [Pomacea canaliculata]